MTGKAIATGADTRRKPARRSARRVRVPEPPLSTVAVARGMTAMATFGNAPGFQKAMVAEAARIAEDLAGPRPTAMERLLAERAAVCWQDCQAADMRAAWGLIHNQDLDVQALRNAAKARAQRAFLAVLAALAAARNGTVTTAIQINVNFQPPE